jgi:hypothetical protein
MERGGDHGPFHLSLRAKQSNPARERSLDYFVASLFGMTKVIS